MTDPTPASTAREALARALLAATGVPWDRTEVSVRDAYLDEADAILAALPDGWTLAAPAPRPPEPWKPSTVPFEAHEDDSYGQCVVCRVYVPHTDGEYLTEPFPCPTVRLARPPEPALAAPAPTPSEPVARCGFTTDGFRCNDTPLQHRYLCGLLHSHTFVCHPFTSGSPR